jgi:hypothetical protein
MAGPITWRNVGSTVRGTGGDLLKGAQDSFTSGFDALEKTLASRNAGQKANFETGQENLSADYKQMLQGAQSLEEVEALRNSEGRKSLLAQLGGERRSELIGALDERETGVMEQIGQRQQYGDKQYMRENNAEVQSLLAAAGNGDRQAAAQLAQLNLQDGGVAIQAAQDAYNADGSLKVNQQNADSSSMNAQTNRGQLGLSQDKYDDGAGIRALEEEQRQYAFDRTKGDDNRTDKDRVLGERADVMFQRAYNAVQDLQPGETVTDGIRAFRESLVGIGMGNEEVSNRVAALDNLVTEGATGVSGADEAAYTERKDEIWKSYNGDNNPFISKGETGGSPEDIAYNALGETDLLNSENPDFREDVIIQSANAVRNGVMHNGKRYKITGEILRAALPAVSDGLWTDADKSVTVALQDFFSDSKGIEKQYEDAEMYNAEVGRLDQEYTARTTSALRRQARAALEGEPPRRPVQDLPLPN